MIKNLPATAGDVKDMSLIPGSGRSSRGGIGNPLQYSCLGNPMDRGARQATVHGVAKNQTQLSTHTYIHVDKLGFQLEVSLAVNLIIPSLRNLV